MLDKKKQSALFEANLALKKQTEKDLSSSVVISILISFYVIWLIIK
jgi:hypothetical protein